MSQELERLIRISRREGYWTTDLDPIPPWDPPEGGGPEQILERLAAEREARSSAHEAKPAPASSYATRRTQGRAPKLGTKGFSS